VPRRDEGALLAPPPAITVVAATRLEARAVRRAVAGARIVEAGVGLGRLRAPVAGDAVVTCGLAGALRSGLPTGSVIVPDRVLRPNGDWLECDPGLVQILAAAAQRLGMEPERGPLATATALVLGPARERLARRGCVAVDMETGLLTAPRVAAVRVILDTPDREISEVWRHPALALLRPAAWGQTAWLYREAPRCAARAAAILAAALRSLGGGEKSQPWRTGSPG
jgi:hypothetical protein